MKYRKKSLVVDAFRTEEKLIISTLEGDMIAEPGDWIVTGVKGEQYPVKPDIFEQTYELITDRQAFLENCELFDEWKNYCAMCKNVNDYSLPIGELSIQVEPVFAGDEYPYRVAVTVGDKKIQAVGATLSSAITTGLHMAGFPQVVPKELARILFWRYGPPHMEWWKDAIKALEQGI